MRGSIPHYLLFIWEYQQLARFLTCVPQFHLPPIQQLLHGPSPPFITFRLPFKTTAMRVDPGDRRLESALAHMFIRKAQIMLISLMFVHRRNCISLLQTQRTALEVLSRLHHSRHPVTYSRGSCPFKHNLQKVWRLIHSPKAFPSAVGRK